ncbi:MAG: TrmH family RNA methyltransferase [Treponema sp.]|jgi:TrmH family RNA methyltransferase|nr:TrmH family RNA methyltransferase [Treponema sp.]
MIPLYKLEKLPRSQWLRKIGRLFAEAEQKTAAGAGCAEPAYYAALLELLSADHAFSSAVLAVFREAGAALRGGTGGPGARDIRRAFNSVRHILLAETGRFPADWDFTDGGGRLDPAKRRSFPGMNVYLEDIRSPFNVGAMFRTAESFGAERLILSPLCADPRHLRALRTAMGCTEILPWERLGLDPFGPEAAAPLPGPLFALETGGSDISEFPFPRRGMMIAGSEELGVSPRALAAADASLGRVSIPVYGAKGSLNVSVAFGIAMSAWAARLKGTTV